jgi:polyphosphate glucokinase
VTGPRTLSVDLGGTSIKAAVLDERGHRCSERLDQPTPYPLSPATLVATVSSTGEALGSYDRVALGFPGMVRDGRVLTAPFFVTENGPGSATSDELRAAWTDLDLRALLESHVGCAVLVVNDADLHGAGVIAGCGVELMITLGTGCGTGLFEDGRVCPHLELAHHPLVDGETYNEHVGDAARRRVGDEAWNTRVRHTLATLASLLNYDRVWIGGGNARYLTDPLPPNACVVDDGAGLVGGVRLWSATAPPGQSGWDA